MPLKVTDFIYTGHAPGGSTAHAEYMASPNAKDTVWDFSQSRAYVAHMSGYEAISAGHLTNQLSISVLGSSSYPITVIFKKITIVTFNLNSLREITRQTIDFSSWFGSLVTDTASNSELDTVTPTNTSYVAPYFIEKFQSIYARGDYASPMWPYWTMGMRHIPGTDLVSFAIRRSMERPAYGSGFVMTPSGINPAIPDECGVTDKGYQVTVNVITGATDTERLPLVGAFPVIGTTPDGYPYNSWATGAVAPSASAGAGFEDLVLDRRMYLVDYPQISGLVGNSPTKGVTISYTEPKAALPGIVNTQLALTFIDLSTGAITLGPNFLDRTIWYFQGNTNKAFIGCVGNSDAGGTNFYLIAPKTADITADGVKTLYLLKVYVDTSNGVTVTEVGSFVDATPTLNMIATGASYYSGHVIVSYYTVHDDNTVTSTMIRKLSVTDASVAGSVNTTVGDNGKLFLQSKQLSGNFTGLTYHKAQNVSDPYILLSQFALSAEDPSQSRLYTLHKSTLAIANWWTADYYDELQDLVYGVGANGILDDQRTAIYVNYLSDGWSKISIAKECFQIEVAPFEASDTVGSQTIELASLGDQVPKAALFMFSRATAEDTLIADAMVIMGVTDGIKSFSMNAYSADNQTAIANSRTMTEDVVLQDISGANVAQFVEFVPGGVTINWTTRDATDGYKCFVVFFCGTTLSAEVGIVETPTVDAQKVPVAFPPELVWAMSSMDAFGASAGGFAFAQGWWFNDESHGIAPNGGKNGTAAATAGTTAATDRHHSTNYSSSYVLAEYESGDDATAVKLGFQITEAGAESFSVKAANANSTLRDFGFLALNFSGRARFARVLWDMSGKDNGNFAQFHGDDELEVMEAVFLVPAGDENAGGFSEGVSAGLGVLTVDAQVLIEARGTSALTTNTYEKTWYSEGEFSLFSETAVASTLNMTFIDWTSNAAGWQYTLTNGPQPNKAFECLVIGRFEQCYPATWHQVQMMEPM